MMFYIYIEDMEFYGVGLIGYGNFQVGSGERGLPEG